MSPAAPDLVFLAHLSSAEAYRAALTALRGPDMEPPRLSDVSRIVRRMSPMPVSPVEVRSITGARIDCVYLDTFLLVEGPLDVRANLRKVRRACEVAEATGAKLGVLGGFTSIVGERAGVELGQRMPFTTGNTLTAAALYAQVRTVAEPGDCVVVVGAGGDVGSGLCRLLHADGLPPVLVGRSAEPLTALGSELPGTRVSSWEEAAGHADVAVLVASTRPGGIAVDGLRPDAIVLDAGHPPNAAAGHGKTAPAGRMTFAIPTRSAIPEFTGHGCAPGEHHACLAEGTVLALEGRYEAYSTGRGLIRPDRAHAILEMAARHGITPSRLPDLRG